MEQNIGQESSNVRKGMLHELFSWRGRIGRGRYFLSVVCYYAFVLFCQIVIDSVKNFKGAPAVTVGLAIFLWFLVLLLLACMWIIIAQGAKRCHDLGQKAFWQFIPFYFIWMFFAKGEEGENEYSENYAEQAYEQESGG